MFGFFNNPAILGKGFVMIGSVGSIFSFFSFKNTEREFQLDSTVTGVDWATGLVTPLFSSKWLGGAFNKHTKYSYGYIARVDNTDFYTGDKASKRIKRGLKQIKQQEQEVSLTLVEQIDGKSIIEDKGNKNRKGLTPKKFLLIGSNRETQEVEVTGLVSFIQQDHKGIERRCGPSEKDGAIQNGYCDKEFFKEYSGVDPQNTAPGFIQKALKDTKGTKDVEILGLSQDKGHLGVVWGSRMIYENGSSGSSSRTPKAVKWSRTGYLYQNQREGKRKVFTALDNSKGTKGFFVVHDLIFSETGLNREWRKKYETHGTILPSSTKQVSCKKNIGDKECLKVVDITLNNKRNYWIWDPAKTQFKNGEFMTGDGIKLPFKLRFNTTWSSLLIK